MKRVEQNTKQNLAKYDFEDNLVTGMMKFKPTKLHNRLVFSNNGDSVDRFT